MDGVLESAGADQYGRITEATIEKGKDRRAHTPDAVHTLARTAEQPAIPAPEGKVRG
jgi:hypothetical protein